MVTTAYDQKLVLQKKNFFKLKVGSKLKKKLNMWDSFTFASLRQTLAGIAFVPLQCEIKGKR